MSATLEENRRQAEDRVATLNGRCEELQESIRATTAQWSVDVAGGGDGLEAHARLADLEAQLDGINAALGIARQTAEQAAAAVVERDQRRGLSKLRQEREKLLTSARGRLAGRDALLEKLVEQVQAAGQDAAALVADCDHDTRALAELDDQLRGLADAVGEPVGALPPVDTTPLVTQVVDPMNPTAAYQPGAMLEDWRPILLTRARQGVHAAISYLAEVARRPFPEKVW